MVRLKVKAGENDLTVDISRHIFEDMSLTVGKEIFLILKLRSIRIYEDKGKAKENV
jgi:molybdopterin-binding protein